MTEEEAHAWLLKHFGEDAVTRVSPVVDAVLAEAGNQNLISPASATHIWSRHVVDSAQLLLLAPAQANAWLDIGTGAGFPGMIVAALRAIPVVMVEPRRRRADFLARLARDLGLDRAEVRASKVETVTQTFDVVSARAVASIDELFTAAKNATTHATTWLLPKGRSWSDELEIAQRYWRGRFHVEHSVTSDEARIVVAQKVTQA